MYTMDIVILYDKQKTPSYDRVYICKYVYVI